MAAVLMSFRHVTADAGSRMVQRTIYVPTLIQISVPQPLASHGATAAICNAAWHGV